VGRLRAWAAADPAYADVSECCKPTSHFAPRECSNAEPIANCGTKSLQSLIKNTDGRRTASGRSRRLLVDNLPDNGRTTNISQGWELKRDLRRAPAADPGGDCRPWPAVHSVRARRLAEQLHASAKPSSYPMSRNYPSHIALQRPVEIGDRRAADP
jgi:hypothetical protein